MERFMRKFSLLLPTLLFGLLIASPASAIQIDEDGRVLTELTLKWSPNPESDIAGYTVYYGRDTGEYVRMVSVENSSATIMVPEGLVIYLAVTAYNHAGVESEFSDEISWP